MRKDIQLYLRLIRYIKPYWKIVVVSILAMLVSAALEPVLPALMQPLVDKSLIQRQDTGLWRIPLFIVLAFFLKGVGDYISNVANQTVSQKVIADLRGQIFAHQLDLPIARHHSEEGGRMLSRITYDTSMVGEAVSTAWQTIIRDSFVLIGLLGFLFYTAWQLTLLIICIAPLLAYSIRRINSRLRSSSERVQVWMGRVTGNIEEALLGLKEIKIFEAYDLQSRRFDGINHGLRREQTAVARIQALNVPLVQVLAASSVALVIYVASTLSNQDLLSPGEFVAFITAMSMVFEPVRRLTNVNSVLQRGLAAAESIFKLLDEVGESAVGKGLTIRRQDFSNCTKLMSTGKTALSIKFEGVYYRYPGATDWAVENFTQEIESGEAVALVGPSGSGKTSLLNLLCGFDKPTSGRILLGDRSIDQITLAELRANIAIVSQQTHLFDLTVAENLLIARKDATDAEIWNALRLAEASEFVMALPQGVHTPLGHLGHVLSGGQRQRIAIARAILKSPGIILWDEPTSALDLETQSSLMKNISYLAATMVMVTHSPEATKYFSRSISIKGL